MRLGAALFVVLVLFVGWRTIVYFDTAHKEKKQQEVSGQFKPERLPGLPYQLEPSYRAALNSGPSAVRDWLKAYGHLLADPRKGWIELDFCISIARDNPVEARQVFAEVKKRTPQSSPIWQRVRELERTFE